MVKTAYLTQTPSKFFDTTGLYDFVDTIKTCTRRKIFPDLVDSVMGEIIDDLSFQLENFNAELDFLVPIGDPIVSAMATMVLRDMGIQTLNMLKWDKKYSGYYVVPVSLII